MDLQPHLPICTRIRLPFRACWRSSKSLLLQSCERGVRNTERSTMKSSTYLSRRKSTLFELFFRIDSLSPSLPAISIPGNLHIPLVSDMHTRRHKAVALCLSPTLKTDPPRQLEIFPHAQTHQLPSLSPSTSSSKTTTKALPHPPLNLPVAPPHVQLQTPLLLLLPPRPLQRRLLPPHLAPPHPKTPLLPPPPPLLPQPRTLRSHKS